MEPERRLTRTSWNGASWERLCPARIDRQRSRCPFAGGTQAFPRTPYPWDAPSTGRAMGIDVRPRVGQREMALDHAGRPVRHATPIRCPRHSGPDMMRRMNRWNERTVRAAASRPAGSGRRRGARARREWNGRSGGPIGSPSRSRGWSRGSSRARGARAWAGRQPPHAFGGRPRGGRGGSCPSHAGWAW